MYNETVEIAIAVGLLFEIESEFLLKVVGQILEGRAFKWFQLVLEVPILNQISVSIRKASRSF